MIHTFSCCCCHLARRSQESGSRRGMRSIKNFETASEDGACCTKYIVLLFSCFGTIIIQFLVNQKDDYVSYHWMIALLINHPKLDYQAESKIYVWGFFIFESGSPVFRSSISRVARNICNSVSELNQKHKGP